MVTVRLKRPNIEAKRPNMEEKETYDRGGIPWPVANPLA
jgi:hypothetical protein